MKTIRVKKDTKVNLHIFQSNKFDCIIFLHRDENGKVLSLDYHWGTDDIQTKYLESNEKGQVSQLYRMFLDILGSHSEKIYDMVIGAHSIGSQTRMKLADSEMKLAQMELKYKALKDKQDKILELTKEFA